MKYCQKCEQHKDETYFYQKGSRLSPYCRKCQDVYTMRRWNTKKIKAVNHLGGCCKHCGKSVHPAAFDFHHRYGKDADWSAMKKRPWEIIIAELAKCDLLCAICHRTLHTDPKLW